MIRITELRKLKGVSMADAARELDMPYTTYVNYEKGNREPNSEALKALAKYFECTIDYLIGREDTPSTPVAENIIPIPKMKKVPLLGTIACGEPILADENIESYVDIPENIRADFALRCKGDSMINARIFDGDTVYIRRQSMVDNGEIAAVLIDNEATLKKVYCYPTRLELRAENPTFPPIEFEGEEMNNIRILGKAVYFFSRVR